VVGYVLITVGYLNMCSSFFLYVETWLSKLTSSHAAISLGQLSSSAYPQFPIISQLHCDKLAYNMMAVTLVAKRNYGAVRLMTDR